MLKIDLVPTLSQCIETVAKREYQETIQKLLSAEKLSVRLEEKAEILRLFLLGADFRKLRAQSEVQLMRGRSVSFVVYLEGGMVKYDMRTQPQG